MDFLKDHLELLKLIFYNYGVEKASIFGSFAKNLMNNDSDIDILIEPGANFTIFKMLELEKEIRDLTNRKVDVVEFSALKTSIKKEVMHSAITIYQQV